MEVTDRPQQSKSRRTRLIATELNRDGSVARESAIIVGVVLPEHQINGDPLEELEGLAETAGAHVVGRLTQNRQKPDYATYLGKGKVEELSQLVEATDADVVIFIHREDLYYTEEEWDRQFPGRPYPRNITDLIVAKHRNGPTGTVQLLFRDNLVRFDSFSRVDNF